MIPLGIFLENQRVQALYDEVQGLIQEKNFVEAREKAELLPDDKLIKINLEIDQAIYDDVLDLYNKKNYIEAEKKAKFLSSDKYEYTDIKRKINMEIFINEGDKLVKEHNYKAALIKYNLASNEDIHHNNSRIAAKINKVQNIIKTRIKNAEAQLVKSYDKVENYTRYSASDNNYGTYIYVDKYDNGIVDAKFVVSSYGTFMNWENIIINTDEKKYNINVPSGQIEDDSILLFFQTRKAKLNYSEYSNLVNAIINSNSAIIRFNEKNGDFRDREISASEKSAMKKMVYYYNLITE